MKTTTDKVQGAVIYTRVSTGEQAKHGTSLETQVDVCRSKAVALGLPIVAEYEDAGVSGGLFLMRAGMQAALEDIRIGQASTLICANISRYSRDVEHQQKIMKEVRALGGRVVFCDMDFDDTPEGDLAFNIMGGFAQYEKQLIRTRSMKGKRKRAEEGEQPQRSTPPLGYHIITNAQVECGLYSPEMRGKYIIIEEQAAVVRELFERYGRGGTGFPPLARDLNHRHVPAPRGGKWYPITISNILHNPAYKGEPAYNRVTRLTVEVTNSDRHKLTGEALGGPRYLEKPGRPVLLSAPAIVPTQLWNEVQERLGSNQQHQSGNPRRARMLSGRVYCPCGHSGSLVGQRGKKYYQCCQMVSSKLTGGPECARTTFSVEKIEGLVVNALVELASKPEVILAAVSAYSERDRSSMNDVDGDPRIERQSIDRALEQLREEEGAAIQAQIAGIQAGASPNAYKEVFADIAARRKDLENRRGEVFTLQQSQNALEPLPSRSTNTISSNAIADITTVLASNQLEGHEKRDLIATVIDRVVCQPDGAEIYFRPNLGSDKHSGPNGAADYDSETLRSIEAELMQYL